MKLSMFQVSAFFFGVMFRYSLIPSVALGFLVSACGVKIREHGGAVPTCGVQDARGIRGITNRDDPRLTFCATDPFQAVHFYIRRFPVVANKGHKFSWCVGTAIGDRTLLTAGHCVSKEVGNVFSGYKAEFINEGEIELIDYDAWLKYYDANPGKNIVPDFVNSDKHLPKKGEHISGIPKKEGEVSADDVALITFEGAPFALKAQVPLLCDPPSVGRPVKMVGYVGDPFEKKWGSNQIKSYSASGLIEMGNGPGVSQIESGDSGGPLLINLIGSQYAVAGVVSGTYAGQFWYSNLNASSVVDGKMLPRGANLRTIFESAAILDPTIPSFPCPPGAEIAVRRGPRVPPPPAPIRIVAGTIASPFVPDNCVHMTVNGGEPKICCNRPSENQQADVGACDGVPVQPGDVIRLVLTVDKPTDGTSVTHIFDHWNNRYANDRARWSGMEDVLKLDTKAILQQPGTPDPTFIFVVPSSKSNVAYVFEPIYRDTCVALHKGDGSGTAQFTFSVNGADDRAYAVAVQFDEKAIVVGAACDANGINCSGFIVRLNPDGSLDPTFGKVLIPNTAWKGAYAVGIQVGKSAGDIVEEKIIVAVGSKIIRLHSNGTLDTSFGTGGEFDTITMGYNISFAIQIDGKIVVADRDRVIRLTPDGALDLGPVRFTTDLYSMGSGVVVDVDAKGNPGKIVAAGGPFPIRYMGVGSGMFYNYRRLRSLALISPSGAYSGKMVEYTNRNTTIRFQGIMGVAVHSGRVSGVGTAVNYVMPAKWYAHYFALVTPLLDGSNLKVQMLGSMEGYGTAIAVDPVQGTRVLVGQASDATGFGIVMEHKCSEGSGFEPITRKFGPFSEPEAVTVSQAGKFWVVGRSFNSFTQGAASSVVAVYTQRLTPDPDLPPPPDPDPVAPVPPPPPKPLTTSLNPPSPSNSSVVTISGTASPDDVITLFADATCSGGAHGVGRASATGNFVITVTAPENKTTTYYANAKKGNRYVSPCSSTGLRNTHDNIAPSAPTLFRTTPSSPAVSGTPTLEGTAEAGSTMKLYTNSACAWGEVASGTVDSSGNFAIPVTVPNSTTQTFYGTATDAVGNFSPCSTALSYTNNSP